jgi:hypothetical protein
MVSLSIIGMTGWVNPLRMAIRRPGTLSVARRWSGGAFFVRTPGGAGGVPKSVASRCLMGAGSAGWTAA